LSRLKPTSAERPPKPFNPLFVFLILALLQGCALAPQFSPGFPGKKSDREKGLYRGVFHVHSHHSHDSDGSLRSISRSARGKGLDFVVITDHNTVAGRGEYEKSGLEKLPLLIFGNEISTREGHLISLGIDEEIQPPIGAQEAIRKVRSLGGHTVLAHPLCPKTHWKDWGVKEFDGMEVYNYACDLYGADKFAFLFEFLFLPPSLFNRLFIKEPREALKKWDSLGASGALPAFGGADAHRQKAAGIPLLRYPLSFGAITTYVFADTLSEKEILKALFSGKSFLAFETLGRADRFSFESRGGGKPKNLIVSVPKRAEIRLLFNGSVVQKIKARSLTFEANRPGTYRVEVFRHGKLWILSNAVTV